MKPETVAPPFCRILTVTWGTCGSRSATAIVSPSARPSPSIAPPTIPPRPYGSTTARIIPHRVLPSASAASFSPGGVCANTSRTTDATIGTTINATTMPAMNIEPVRRAPGSVAKIGIHPK